MTDKLNSIARNTTYYTIALIIQKVLAFVYFTFIARILQPEDTGKYVFALSFTTLFAVLIDLGLAPVLTREIAKFKDRTQLYLSNVLALKIPLAALTYILVVITINVLGYPALTKTLVYFSGIIMFLDSFALTFWAVFRGHQNLKFESIGIICLQFLSVGLGFTALILKLGILPLIIALLVGSFFNFCFSAFLLKKKLKLNLTPYYSPKILKYLFAIGVPFALTGIFNRIYTSLDTVLLSSMLGDVYVGWYSIAIKITLALQFLPLAFVASLFPVMSEYFITNQQKLASTFEKAMHYLLLISVPLSTGLIVLATPVIIKIYTPAYSGSILPLQILSVGLVFTFINYPVGYLLNACNKQITNTINTAIIFVINVALNIILIPHIKQVGPAIASLIASILLFVLGIYWVPKIIFFSKKYILIKFFKIFFSALIMGIFLYYLQNKINLFLLILFGGLIYVILIFAIRAVTKSDILSVVKSVFKK